MPHKKTKRRHEIRDAFLFYEDLLSGANFWSTHRVAKQRGKYTKVKQPGYQWDDTYDSQDDASSALETHESPEDQSDACDNTGNSSSRGSHKRNKWIHFLSPFD
jgi:hypothetical protein